MDDDCKGPTRRKSAGWPPDSRLFVVGRVAAWANLQILESVYSAMSCVRHEKDAAVSRGKEMKSIAVMVLAFVQLFLPSASAQSCAGKLLQGVGGVKNSWSLDTGGIAAFSKMNVNLDGYGHAYSPKNYDGGALLHLCNAGKVYLSDGSSYQGSESNATCTGRFMQDFKRIGDAGWQDSTVGAINWYGILGKTRRPSTERRSRRSSRCFRKTARAFMSRPPHWSTPRSKTSPIRIDMSIRCAFLPPSFQAALLRVELRWAPSA